MRQMRLGIVIALLAAAQAAAAGAQTAGNNGMAPLPDTSVLTTTQPGPDTDPMLTTHPLSATPFSKTNVASGQPASNPAPFARASGGAASAPVPFGHASSSGPVVPSAPHATEAVPVGNVDAMEVSEPAPPTPVAPGADPVKEDPAMPTEFTSPIFTGTAAEGMPRKIVLRVLNKVTAQSERFEVKPGETIRFGQLEVTAVLCRTSQPNSQRDDAGLFDVAEHLPGTRTMKPVFHGWMYASSPSVSALEHPIYDVTMVECVMGGADKATDKQGKKKK